MSTHQTIDRLGLIVVGDEILNGRRRDKHFDAALALCAEWNIDLAFALFLPDSPALLREQLQWAMAQTFPFFCCGGIGSTPDDVTRQCAAAAAGVGIERHGEAAAMLKAKFGERATEQRLRMIDFPQGARLVPNPYNQVPGFHIRNGYFLPGFPEMAQPMMRQVLETGFRVGATRLRRTIILPGAKEADLTDLMDDVVAAHPDIALSSLPQFTASGTQVLLSVSGPPARVEPACHDLQQRLADAGVAFEDAV